MNTANNYPEILPQNLEAEEAVLGGILIDPNAIDRVYNLLSPEAFALKQHQTIYRAICDLHEQGSPIDLLTVASALIDQRKLESIGGQSKLAQLLDRTVSAVNIDRYAALVIEKHLRRKLIQKGRQISQIGNQMFLPLETALEMAELEMEEVSEIKKDPMLYRSIEDEIRLQRLTKEIETIEKIDNTFQKKFQMRELMKRWDIRSEKEFLDLHAKWLEQSTCKNRRSYSTDEYYEKYGVNATEWLIPGWFPARTVNVIHAPGGAGKTSLVSTICKSIITGKPWSGYDVISPGNVLWIQTDQGPTVTVHLLDRQGFFQLSRSCRERQRIIDDWGIEEFHVLESELKEHKYKVVIIDSLASVSASSIYRENDMEYARPFVRLRHLANKYDCLFVILHHSNSMGSARGTTAIFNAADQVFSLKQSAESEASGEGLKEADLTIQKSRFIEQATYRCQFDAKDHTWTILGQVKDKNVEDDLSPTLRDIIRFLWCNPNTPLEIEEIAYGTRLASSTVRKHLPKGVRRGVINTHQGGRKRRVYYVGKLTSVEPLPENGWDEEADLVDLTDVRSDTLDPLDPEGEQGSNSYPASVDPLDPLDPQLLNLREIENNFKISGSSGSSGSSLSQQGFQPGSKPDQEDQEYRRTHQPDSVGNTHSDAKILQIKVGDRVPNPEYLGQKYSAGTIEKIDENEPKYGVRVPGEAFLWLTTDQVGTAMVEVEAETTGAKQLTLDIPQQITKPRCQSPTNYDLGF